MLFAPVALKHDEFIEHVSVDIIKNDFTPDDFEGTLWYVLCQLPEREREIFLKIERDHIPVRAIGLEYGVSGQRISDINQSTKSRMVSLWGDLLRKGIMGEMQETAKNAHAYGESTAKDNYYKLGYTDGYDDGVKNRMRRHFATEEYNEISLSDLNFSYRLQHYLFDNDLLNLSQIIERGDGIMDIDHLGRTSFVELIERIAEFGVDVNRYFPKMMKKYNIVVEDENV